MRDKLAKLIFDCWLDRVEPNGPAPTAYQYADYLIAHGVTFATDNNVPCKCGGEERFVNANKINAKLSETFEADVLRTLKKPREVET